MGSAVEERGAGVGMETVERWSGWETRLLRQALRLTVRGFAEDLGVCVRTVSKWEALGPALIPRPELQAALDTLLRRAKDEDRERFHASVVPASVVLSAAAAAVAPLLPAASFGPVLSPMPAGPSSLAGDSPSLAGDSPAPVDSQHVAAALQDARRYLDAAMVGYFRSQLNRLKQDDGRRDGSGVLLLLLGVLGAIQKHAGEVRAGLRRDLLAVGADGAEFAGWLYRDGHDLVRALYWHDRATEWAQEAGDAPMQGYILLKKAQLAYDQREPVRMLTLSQAARTGPWGLPLQVRAEATQQEARAEAMLGASAATVAHQLDLARDLLAAAEGETPHCPLGGHYSQALLAVQTAACHAEGGRPQQAVELYRTALATSSFSPRDHGFFLSWMAAAQARAGQPDQAARTALASAARAAATGSGRTRRELTRVLEALRPWQQRPAVRELAGALGSG